MATPFTVASDVEKEELSSSDAMRHMANFPEAELHHAIISAEVGNSGFRLAGGLSRAELDRRAQVATEKLTKRVTWWSALAGILGALLGTVGGALFTYLLSN